MDLKAKPREGAPALSPDLIRDMAKLVYGPISWQTSLARALEVSPRTVSRWLRGAAIMPRNLSMELCMLVDARIKTLQFVSSQLAYHHLQCLAHEQAEA